MGGVGVEGREHGEIAVDGAGHIVVGVQPIGPGLQIVGGCPGWPARGAIFNS